MTSALTWSFPVLGAEMAHVLELFQPHPLSPLRCISVPWSARSEMFGVAKPIEQLTSGSHCHSRSTWPWFQESAIGKSHLKHLLFVLKLSFEGKMPLKYRYLRKGEAGSDLFLYVPYHHSRWPSLGLWWDLKNSVLKMFVRACVPEQDGVKSS